MSSLLHFMSFELTIYLTIISLTYTIQYHDTDSCRASRIMFAMAGVKTRKHIPSREVVSVEFQ